MAKMDATRIGLFPSTIGKLASSDKVVGACLCDMMNNLKDYILFRKFVMPVALQLLFWAGIGGTLYGAWWLYQDNNWAWVLALVFGVLATRLIFESFILRYQTYVLLGKIKDRLDKKE